MCHHQQTYLGYGVAVLIVGNVAGNLVGRGARAMLVEKTLFAFFDVQLLIGLSRRLVKGVKGTGCPHGECVKVDLLSGRGGRPEGVPVSSSFVQSKQGDLAFAKRLKDLSVVLAGPGNVLGDSAPPRRAPNDS